MTLIPMADIYHDIIVDLERDTGQIDNPKLRANIEETVKDLKGKRLHFLFNYIRDLFQCNK